MTQNTEDQSEVVALPLFSREQWATVCQAAEIREQPVEQFVWEALLASAMPEPAEDSDMAGYQP